MSVSNGQAANATNFNDAFVSKTANSTTIGQITLNNADSSSGSQVTNIQRELNAFSSYTGKATNVAEDTVPTWSDNDIGASTDSLFDRIEAIQAEFPVDLTSQVDGVLPLANGGTGKSSFTAEQVLYGAQLQASTFVFDGTQLGVGVTDPSATFDLDGTFAIREASAAIEFSPSWASGAAAGADYGIDASDNSFIRITDTSPSGDFLRSIRAVENNNFLFIANATTADITVEDRTASDPSGNFLIKTGDADDVTLKNGAAALAIRDVTDNCWRLLGGGGGGSTAPSENAILGSTDLTGTEDVFQVWTNAIAADSFTLTSFDVSSVPTNGEVTFNCVKTTGSVTITTAASGVEFMSGDFTGTYGDTITFKKASVINGLIEKCRSINQP